LLQGFLLQGFLLEFFLLEGAASDQRVFSVRLGRGLSLTRDGDLSGRHAGARGHAEAAPHRNKTWIGRVDLVEPGQ
jgi:hypothetical protein